MPQQCVKCKALYEDETAVINGCTCGAKAFFYIKNEDEKDCTPEVPQEPIFLDVENIRITDGKYELDLHALFGKKEVIYQYDEGKYSVDLEESFRRHAEK